MGCDAYRGELKPFQNHKWRQPTDAIGFLPLHFTSSRCGQLFAIFGRGRV